MNVDLDSMFHQVAFLLSITFLLMIIIINTWLLLTGAERGQGDVSFSADTDDGGTVIPTSSPGMPQPPAINGSSMSLCIFLDISLLVVVVITL